MEVTNEMLATPEGVAKLLQEYQDWRRGVGKYKWTDDPSAYEGVPFTPQQLTKIEDAAISFLNKIGS